jgi:ribosomal protein L37E
MMKTSSRQWVNCRACQREHTNPRSSSLCTSCGIEQSEHNKLIKDEANKREKVRKLECLISRLAFECGISADYARTLKKAFDILMENNDENYTKQI